MSDTQQILKALADALHNGQIGEEGCEDLAKALNGVPDAYHMDALKALLDIEEQEDEKPEDYAAVKTFDSDEFHVGDEVVNGNAKAFITRVQGTIIYYVFHDGVVNFGDVRTWKRTGRNFLAIAAILDALKK